jgi:hypothetical protein
MLYPDTIEFVEYTEKCRMWANESLGLEIPLPGGGYCLGRLK